MTVDPISIAPAALDVLVEPVLLTGADGRLTFANTTAVRVFGAAAHVGRPLSRLLARVPATTAFHGIVRAVQQRRPLSGVELTLALPSGQTTYLVNTAPVGNGAGGSVTVFHDVTVARRFEREADEHAARVQALAELVDQAVFIIGADGRALFVNAQAREQAGGDPDLETLGPLERARAMQLMELDGRPVAPENLPFNRAMRGETVAGTTLVIRHPTRGVRRMRVSARPLRRPGGPIYGPWWPGRT